MALRFWRFGAAAAVALVIGATAQAGLLPLSATVVPDGAAPTRPASTAV